MHIEIASCFSAKAFLEFTFWFQHSVYFPHICLMGSFWHSDFNKKFGPIVLEVTSNGVPIINLYDRQDIEKVLRYPSKYPFRPPTEIVAFYRKMRPDRYASTGITNEYVNKEYEKINLVLNPFVFCIQILDKVKHGIIYAQNLHKI